MTPGTPTERVFTLTAKKGQIFTADGNQVPMWGFSSGNGAYQYPSPFLCAQEGDRITVVLHNRLGNAGATPIRTSIMFPGQADVTSDGVPVQPELVTPGDPAGGIASLVPSVGNGDSITYSFTAAHAGTYIYESGTSTAVQLQMGLFGGLIVRPPLGAGGEHLLYGGHPEDPVRPEARGRRTCCPTSTPTCTSPSTRAGRTRPRASARATGSSTAAGSRTPPRRTSRTGSRASRTARACTCCRSGRRPTTAAPASPGGYDTLPAAVRYINASETAHPFHPHSADTLVHGIDGRPLESSTGVDLTENHYSIEIAPGQTMDATWSYEYVGTHTAGGVNVPFNPASNPVPVPVQDFRDTRWTPATYASGTPYLGDPGRPAGRHHDAERVRRVLQRLAQPRGRGGNHLRRSRRRDADPLPHRPAGP